MKNKKAKILSGSARKILSKSSRVLSETKLNREKLKTFLTIFGATGNLAAVKIFPAIYELECENMLPEKFFLIGFGRKVLSDDGFRERVREAVRNKNGEKIDDEKLDKMLARVSYVSGDYDDAVAYARLAEKMGDEKSLRLFYASLPPKIFPTVIENVGKIKNVSDTNRLILEKPFGNDEKSAVELQKLVAENFAEDEIYRIDHFLGKMTVLNILTLRFANGVFENLFHRDFVEKIEIDAFEKVGVEGRGGYFDESGAVRDMIQPHLLQILAIVGMERPKDFSRENVDARKTEFLDKIDKNELKNVENFVRGQYENYQKIEGIKKDSKTETFAEMTVFSMSERWRGVPMKISTGKALAEKKTQVRVFFKKAVPICTDKNSCFIAPQNVLTIGIQPETKITLGVWERAAGDEMQIVKNEMNLPFTRECDLDAYAFLLSEILRGGEEYSVGFETILAAWRVCDPVLGLFSSGEVPLKKYARGEKPENV